MSRRQRVKLVLKQNKKSRKHENIQMANVERQDQGQLSPSEMALERQKNL